MTGCTRHPFTEVTLIPAKRGWNLGEVGVMGVSPVIGSPSLSVSVPTCSLATPFPTLSILSYLSGLMNRPCAYEIKPIRAIAKRGFCPFRKKNFAMDNLSVYLYFIIIIHR